ncbi:Protein FAR1-RELATED SEQUENCE 5 [Glycine soja]
MKIGYIYLGLTENKRGYISYGSVLVEGTFTRFKENKGGRDSLLGVIVTDRDLTLINAMKTVFLESTNLLCRFHIDKNVKAKCKTMASQKNAWDCVMEAEGSLVDCPSQQNFNECLMKFEIACSPWPMFVDYVKQTWLIPHKEIFVMHLGNTTINRIESAHWALKRLLHNSLRDISSVWEAMNNMITLQHTEIKASLETSTHVVGHVFKVTLYKKLLSMVSSSHFGCVMRTTHGLPFACELARYVVDSIPLDVIHMFWRRLSFLDQGLSDPEVSLTKEMKTISKQFEELDVCGKVTLKSKFWEIAYLDLKSIKGAQEKPITKHQRSTKHDPSYWEYVDALHSMQNSNFSVKHSASSSDQARPRRTLSMLDLFHPCFHDSIENIVDVKVDGNCEYRAIVALLGMGEDSWSLVHNNLLKELAKWSNEYITLLGGINRFEELKQSLLVDELSIFANMINEQVDMDYENEQECGVNEPPHVDCSEAFNTSQVFGTREDVLLWARLVTHENRFVAIIMRFDTHTGSRGRTSFVLIDREMSGQYKCRKKEFVRRDTGSRKCGCLFKLRRKPVHGGEGWMVKLICGIHNHELAKSLVGHPYIGRLTKDEKNIIADMTKSMVKPRNILLTLKEHDANSCTTIKQIYNARSAYRSSIRGSDTKMQHLMKLLELVVHDMFSCHPDAVKLCNACYLVFFIDSTYKTNRYRLPLLDFVGMTPTGMTFSFGFAYLVGERVNNVVWALERVKSAHWSLKIVLHNSLGDLCSVWDAMNNMITLQHIQIKASFETSTHVAGHRLLGMVSWYALNEIATEFECVHYAGNNPSSCGCVMRSTHGLPCACELSRYVVGSILLDLIHMFWRRLNFSNQGLCEAEVTIKEEIETICKRFKELDAGEIAYPDQNSMCPPPLKVNTKGAPKKSMNRSQRSTKLDPSYWEYVDVFHSVQSSNFSVKRSASSSDPPKPTRIIPIFIHNIVDVKADGNCGYRSIVSLLGMGEDSWSLVRNKLIKELGKWSHDYINLFGGTERFEELRLSLLVDGFSKVSVEKWMDITEMRYVIASRYNVILVSLSRQQSMTFFPLRSQPPSDSSVHSMICVSHLFGNHFVQVYLKDCCPLPPLALLWSRNCQPQAKQWPTPYISRMQQYNSLKVLKRDYVDLNED